MDHTATYVHAGFVLISVPNLVLIGSMIALFVIALLVPFPFHSGRAGRADHDEEPRS